VVAVALLGDAGFDPTDVDAQTLAFGPAGAAPLATFPTHEIDGDGFPDRAALFRIPDTGIALGDAEACLSGATLEGDPFEGCAPIETVGGCGRGLELAWIVPLLALRRRRARRSRPAGRKPGRGDPRAAAPAR
jgi:hypothetical protein